MIVRVLGPTPTWVWGAPPVPVNPDYRCNSRNGAESPAWVWARRYTG